MDHSMYLRYSVPNGVPQESKLATYMNRQNTSTPVAVANLNQSLSKINVTSPSKPVTPQSAEFVPAARIASASASPNFLNSYTGVVGPGYPRNLGESPHSGNGSPHDTPQPSPPPASLSNCSPIPHLALEKPIGTVAVAYQENVGGTTYFYPTSGENSHTTNDTLNSISGSSMGSVHQVYPGTPSHVLSLKSKGGSSAFFVSDDTRTEILHRNALTLMQPDPEQFPDLPLEVDNYHELCPLENIPSSPLPKAHLGYQASMYKATNVKTGIRYCLRRIHGFRLQNTKCMTYVDLWKKLKHSNIVQLKEVFTTKAFGDNSMVFVYDYHPGSETLLNKHFVSDQNGYSDPFATDPSAPRPYSHQKNNILRHQQSNKLPESLIWNYIIELTSALRLIHSSALACRSLDPTKIVITAGSRLRLSCLGVMDVIMNDSGTAVNPLTLVQHYQQEDLTALGKLVLALACKSTMAVQRENISTAVEAVSRTYTPDLRNLIM